MAVNRIKRKIKKIVKPVAPKQSAVKKEKAPKPVENKTTIKKQPKKDYNESYKESFRVVSGSRLKTLKKRFVSLCVVAAIILSVLLIQLLTPTGIVESLQNSFSTIGKAQLPETVYSQNSEQFVRYNDAVVTLNNSYFEIYSKKGKLIQAVSHGMSNPVLELSESRFLLYDRSRYSISIFNYSSQLYQTSFEHNIISADIGRNGSYAVVTDSGMYMNSVYVYNKNNKLVYNWNSAGSYITDVAISNNGKTIAVALVTAKGGVYSSSVYVLDFSSASPKIRYDFDYLVSAVSVVNNKYILANGTEHAMLLGLKSSSMLEITQSAVRFYSSSANGTTIVCHGRSNNERENTISVISKKGEIIASIKADYVVSSVSIGDKNIAVLSDKTVILYNLDGNEIGRTTTETKPLYVAAIDDEYCLALDNTKLYQLNFE